MKWIVDGSEYDDVREAASAIVDGVDESEYDDYLNEIYGEVEICGNRYSASNALSEVDPTAYRCGFADWTSGLTDEIEEELADMEPGDDETVRGVSVECVDEEEGENDEDDGEEEGDE